jgi:CRISPR-associated protein Csx10
MKAITYTLRLVEPLLVAGAGAGEENSAVALACVPGSALRGVLAAIWRTRHPGADLAADPESRALFLDGSVRYLNAYPVRRGQRGLPTPASWFKLKDDPDGPAVYDLAAGPDPRLGQLEAVKRPFCSAWCEEADEESWEPPAAVVEPFEPLRFEQVHIALEDANRRGQDNRIFRYEALAAEQTFGGVIVADDGVDLEPLQMLLRTGNLLLGKAHRAGYGQVDVTLCEPASAWQEYTPLGPAAGDEVVVTLLSDAIVRGADGQIGWDGGRALAQALGSGAGVTPRSAFGRLLLVGGYNRRWGLPTPQAHALAAGSVFVFDRAALNADRLRMAVETGIGERRAEGFGRIAVDWHTRAALRLARDDARPDDARPNLSPASKRAARAMVQRRLRLILDRQLAMQVNARFESLRPPLPENVQLSAIRQAVSSGLAGAQDLGRLKQHLLEVKKTGSDQLERCRVGDETLYRWLSDRAEKLDVAEQVLGGAALPALAGETAALDLALRVEYTARLIDGLMKLAARSKEATR